MIPRPCYCWIPESDGEEAVRGEYFPNKHYLCISIYIAGTCRNNSLMHSFILHSTDKIGKHLKKNTNKKKKK